MIKMMMKHEHYYTQKIRTFFFISPKTKKRFSLSIACGVETRAQQSEIAFHRCERARACACDVVDRYDVCGIVSKRIVLFDASRRGKRECVEILLSAEMETVRYEKKNDYRKRDRENGSERVGQNRKSDRER